jgi:hypothetical protein
MLHALVASAVVVFAVFKTLALIPMELELHLFAVLLPGLNALILLPSHALTLVALKLTAASRCAVLILNVMLAILQDRMLPLLLVPRALAQVLFAASRQCAQQITAATVLSMCRNQTCQLFLALDLLALTEIAAAINARTLCALKAL